MKSKLVKPLYQSVDNSLSASIQLLNFQFHTNQKKSSYIIHSWTLLPRSVHGVGTPGDIPLFQAKKLAPNYFRYVNELRHDSGKNNTFYFRPKIVHSKDIPVRVCLRKSRSHEKNKEILGVFLVRCWINVRKSDCLKSNKQKMIFEVVRLRLCEKYTRW